MAEVIEDPAEMRQLVKDHEWIGSHRLVFVYEGLVGIEIQKEALGRGSGWQVLLRNDQSEQFTAGYHNPDILRLESGCLSALGRVLLLAHAWYFSKYGGGNGRRD